jgi:UDP-2,3-diacylglucosamine pyrophosphatase LpxH
VKDLVFIGDVHLEEEGPALDAFLAFLDGLKTTTSRVVLAGDLFNVWIGARDLERPHQARVIAKLQELRREGLVVRYLEGNRDYRVAGAYVGTALDDAPAEGLVERVGERSIFAIHGDLANSADRQYRTWRRFSRSAAMWGTFRALPAGTRQRLVDRLESAMRASNARFKAAFPEEVVRRYADGFLARGHDAVVLGHFHVERALDGRIFVLPEWKESRRHLRVGADGSMGFVPSAERAPSATKT